MEQMTHSPVTCQLCRRTADADEQPNVTWVLDRTRIGPDASTDNWTCPDCAARHIRAMEARLDSEWW